MAAGRHSRPGGTLRPSPLLFQGAPLSPHSPLRASPGPRLFPWLPRLVPGCVHGEHGSLRFFFCEAALSWGRKQKSAPPALFLLWLCSETWLSPVDLTQRCPNPPPPRTRGGVLQPPQGVKEEKLGGSKGVGGGRRVREDRSAVTPAGPRGAREADGYGPGRDGGGGAQQGWAPALTRCRKFKRSRSSGVAAMMPVTFRPRPASARPQVLPITACVWPRWPIASVGRSLWTT